MKRRKRFIENTKKTVQTYMEHIEMVNVHGLIALEAGVQEGHPVKFSEENVGYLADVVVDEKFRNEGFGAALMVYAVMQAKSLGFDTLYMRTLEENSMSKGIALALGFNQIQGAIQIVEREIIDGSTKNMRDIFLEKDLKNLNKDDIEAAMQMVVSKKQRAKAKKQETNNSVVQASEEGR